MSSYLITGTSRGLGLELVRQLVREPANKVERVFAITRNAPTEGLQSLIGEFPGRIVNVIIEDITNEGSTHKGVIEVEKALNGKGLDVLVNNAGATDWTAGGVTALSADKLREIFDVDVVSAHVVTAAFLPLLKAGREKKIISISSTLGSLARIKDYAFAPTPAYKIAKAAMNMLHTQYAMALKTEGFTVLAITPGWLKTDLGSQNADLDVDVGAAGVIDWIYKSTTAENGKFVNIRAPGWEEKEGTQRYDGKEIPW